MERSIIVMIRSSSLNTIGTKFPFLISKFDGLKRACRQMFVIFHQAKVRVEQSMCVVVERKGELSGYEHIKKVAMGQRFNPSLRILFLSSVSTLSQSEQRMSLMTVIYQLATF